MTSRPSVLIRADGGNTVGWGHVIRCLSIADELAARGAHVVFATASPPAIHDRITASGHQVHALDHDHTEHPISGPWPHDAQRADCRASFRGATYDVVLVDHYGIDASWERQARSNANLVAVVDDLANRPHECDVLFDHNWYGPHNAERYAELVPPRCRLLLGPTFAPLQADYRSHRRETPAHWPPRRVVVSFGGSDPNNETQKVLDALSAVGEAERIDVVLGASALERPAATPKLRVHQGLPSLAPLLADADLAIGASGTGTWERIAMRVPAIVATQSMRHSGVTSALHDHGLTTWVGTMDQTTDETYGELLGSNDPVPTPPRIVDGWGAVRIAQAIAPSSVDQVSLRPARRDDATTFLDAHADLTTIGDEPARWRQAEPALARSNWLLASVDDCPVGIASPDKGGAVAIAAWHPFASDLTTSVAALRDATS